MSTDEDDLGLSGLSGLDRVLASVGVDASAFSNYYNSTSGGNAKSSGIFAEVDADSGDEDKYEDDVSDQDLQPESAADIAARQKSEADAQRMIRRGLQLQKEIQEGVRAAPVVKDQAEEAREVVKRNWPGFVKGERLRMSEVFYETPAQKRGYESAFAKAKRRKLVHERIQIRVAPLDEILPSSAFLLSHLSAIKVHDPSTPLYNLPLGENFDRNWIIGARQLKRKEMTRPPVDFKLPIGVPDEDWQEDVGRPLDLAEWEKDIIMTPLGKQPPARPLEPLEPRNTILDSGDWIKDVIWDSQLVAPDLLQSDDETPPPPSTSVPGPQSTRGQTPASKPTLDPFNLSNDHLYEHTREARFRIRQTFGNIQVFHAGPAKTLQLPFYKTGLNKVEARAWKRPPLQIPVGITLGFSRLKSNPKAAVSSKKKAMMVDPSERFKTTKDLTMAEKGPYVLLEFSEEYPPMMSGYGMGTTIVNYYRKKDDKDDTVPKLDFGQPHILGVGDAEPFFLGYVDRGAVTQVAHNNLYRAPMFRHTPETTDFLAIRQTINGHSTYYLRPIANIYTVGQTMPGTDEIPGPHARKNTNYAKHRLMVVAWLTIMRAKKKIIKLNKLIKYFPDQVEIQIRQKLKVKGTEFLQHSNIEGPKQGLWGLNPDYRDPENKPFPNNRADVQALCTPEEAMRFEAMQVGARHLHDAGYKNTAEGKRDDDDVKGGGDDGDENGLDIEQQLAVWFTTLNYQKAAAAKAWLVLHGEGDPTGRGEGYSFLKTNMKSYFLRKGETEQGRKMEAEAKAGGTAKISNVEQQRIYEEEKRRVWDLQWKALSDTRPPELTPEDEENDQMAATPMPGGGMGGGGGGSRFARGDSRMARSRGGSTVGTPWGGDGSPREDSPAFSDDGSAYTGMGGGRDKVLRIKRTIKGKDEYEIIRDPAVIESYMRRREEKKIEDTLNNPARRKHLEMTGDPIEDATRKKILQALISKAKRNQLRRQARNKYLTRPEGPDVDGQDNRRKCSACGQLGHTRANKGCPRFNQSSIQPSPSANAPTPTMGTPGGYGTGYMGDVGGLAEGSTSNSGGMPSLKIRIGMGGK